MKIDNNKLKQAEWYKKHILTPEQREKLVKEKFERALHYCEAVKQQEKQVERQV